MSLPIFNNYNINNFNKLSRLLSFSSVPEYLQFNPFIKSGYRNSYSNIQCIKSIFQFSNESVNIWSHLIGFIIFLYFLAVDNFIFLPLEHGNFNDHLIISIGLLCYIICMLSSVGYHMFLCHSEATQKFWFAVDIMGICVGLVGCYVPGVYFAFYCFTGWRSFYLCFALGLAVLVLLFQHQIKGPDNISLRIATFLVLAGCGFVPTFHWVYLNNGFQSEIVSMFLIKVFRLYSIATISFIIYFYKIPERFWPGRFDFIGSSHQIWHVLVLLCFYDWHASGVELFKYRHIHGCRSN